MIPKNVREGSERIGLTGETAQFTIKPNGKAFRTLIDGLYSNKVRAVIRELCSNAADSHIAAGQARPFQVSIPTSLEPTFRVRDYGTSLSHDEVMHLYTTIFESTKEGTNEQTGQLGLGSKSPFAYTDSFQVTTWLDGVKRQYLSYLAADGVPLIEHIADMPSDEPQGLEVSFPANRADIPKFQAEMQYVVMGYATPPEIDGLDFKLPTPRLSGKDWAIYPTSEMRNLNLNGQVYIRQGTVVYPAGPEVRFNHLGMGWTVVVDIPIGTAEVTASREALSFDVDTRTAVQIALSHANDQARAMIEAELNAAKTKIERAQVFAKVRGIFSNIAGSTTVSLDDTSVERADWYGKAQGKYGYSRGRFTQTLEVTELPRINILVDDLSNTVVRRAMRVRNAHTGWTYVVANDPKAIADIKRNWEIPADKFTLVSTLPDPGPTPRVAGTSTTAKAAKLLKPGQFWAIRERGKMHSIYGEAVNAGRFFPRALGDAMRLFMAKDDLPAWEDIMFVTKNQAEQYQKKGLLPDAQRLDLHVKSLGEKALKKLPYKDAITMKVLWHYMGNYSTALEVILEQHYPTVTMDRHKVEEIVQTANLAKIDLQTFPEWSSIETEVRALSELYPLMFQKSGRSHYEQYVKAVQAAAAAAV